MDISFECKSQSNSYSFCYELYKLYTFIFYHNDDSRNLLFNMLYVIEATRSDGRRDRATVTSETLAPTHNVFFGPLSLNPSLAPGAGGRVGPPAPSTLPLGAPACELRPDPEGGTRNRNRHFPLSCSPSLPLNKKLSPRILPIYLFAVEVRASTPLHLRLHHHRLGGPIRPSIAGLPLTLPIRYE